MPPAVTRAFGFEGRMNGETVALDKYGDFRYKGGDQQLEDGKAGKKYSGLGKECGVVPDPVSGCKVDAGKLLVRDQWNTELFGPLKGLWEERREMEGRSDVWVHKNRMSGLWGSGSELEGFLEGNGIRTLLFTGVSCCVLASWCNALIVIIAGQHRSVCWWDLSGCFQQRSVPSLSMFLNCNRAVCVSQDSIADSSATGYDCILLQDGCGTTSPNFSQQCIEYNAANTWGFAASCKDLADAAEKMKQ